ncbi:hypothetical protein PACTADRAFT_68979 [Pachysolen tannophilus NRRL Y-2460]|uniref:aspartate transaminase n=1 Tax=Pachysolen tannophilus NRRL Y-2460 TaxID=669874 RepID=A0A1E4TUV4_PACTA|nr:hypothetical protein PACTADRAFT_68979 [Pachysolen tannophilus NRRL Y-2460]
MVMKKRFISTGTLFKSIPKLAPDAVFDLKQRYLKDTRKLKVDLGIGAYRDEYGKPFILPSVKLASTQLFKMIDFDHEYLPIRGDLNLLKSSFKILLDENYKNYKEILGKLVSIQTLSGTGSLHIANIFLKKFFNGNNIYISSPSWGNHKQIFQDFKILNYPYWNNKEKNLDINGFINCIKSAPSPSIFLLHTCGHNPTGVDPTYEQWIQILKELYEKNHLPIFDTAYQGFCSGSFKMDSIVFKIICEFFPQMSFLVCQSFAKNFGLYSERIGCLHIIHKDSNHLLNQAIQSQLERIIRTEYSNPPGYGAKIIATILTNNNLLKQWESDLSIMSKRISKMRFLLKKELIHLKTPGNWDHITNQKGMFSFTGLSSDEVEKLETNYAIYMLRNGRMSISGLNEQNVKYVAEAIDKVVRWKIEQNCINSTKV